MVKLCVCFLQLKFLRLYEKNACIGSHVILASMLKIYHGNEQFKHKILLMTKTGRMQHSF